MGLDQFAYAGEEEIAYWRKHNRLQGWMENLWRKKGGKDRDFNGQKLELTLEDINALEEAVEGRELPETTGFFFGYDSYTPDSETTNPYPYYQKDVEFIRAAKEALAAGEKVFYDCSW